MIVFLIKFSAILAILLGFYKGLLEHQSNHSFKRFFLLGALLIALTIPQYTFRTYVEPSPTIASETQVNLVETEGLIKCEEAETPPLISTSDVLWILYGLGLVVFGFRFLVNLFQVINKVRFGEKVKSGTVTNVLVDEQISPYTFFRYIFYNREELVSNRIPAEVMQHEEAHARQLHSLDIMILELLQVVLWFNPLIYVLKRSIKLNHEFLADQAVLDQGVLPGQYQRTVLAFASDDGQAALTTPFNYSFIKKRFKVMKTRTSKRSIFLRNVLIIPVVILALFGFSNRETVQLQQSASDLSEQGAVRTTPPQDVVEAYNKLAKHYNSYPSYDFVTKTKDMWRIRHLYEKMSEEERAGAEPYPRSTTSLVIFITNEGKYLINKKEVSLSSIEALFQPLTKEELSNMFVFSREFDTGKYTRKRRDLNLSDFPPNDVYIHVMSEEFVEGTKINKINADTDKKSLKSKRAKEMYFVTPAALNSKLDPYLNRLYELFRRYDITVDH